MHKRSGSSFLSSFMGLKFILNLPKRLQDRIESALICFNFLMSNVFDLGSSFTKRFLRSFISFVHMHLISPGVNAPFALLKNHQKLQYYIKFQ